MNVIATVAVAWALSGLVAIVWLPRPTVQVGLLPIRLAVVASLCVLGGPFLCFAFWSEHCLHPHPLWWQRRP